MSKADPRRTGARSPSGDTLAALALFLPLLLAPLPQASVPPLPRALLTSLLCLAGAWWSVRIWRGLSSLQLPVAFIPLALFVSWGFAQLLPITPPLTSSAQEMLAGAQPDSLSLVPARTASRARECMALLLVYVAGANLLRHTIRAEAFVIGLLVTGASLSVYGILVRGGAVPPLVADQTTSVVAGTFFNQNHMAGFLELCVLFASGLWLAWWTRGEVRDRLPAQLAIAAGTVLCIVALLLTESRAGLASFLVGVAAMFALCRRIGRHRVSWFAVALPVVGLVAALCWAWPQTLSTRFARIGDELAASGTRPDIWSSGARLAAAFPISGTGLGTYRDVSPLTQTPGIGGRVEHAHNDPLQFLVETGVPGLILLLVAGAFFARWVWVRMDSVRDPARAYLAAGGVSGLVAITTHGMFDFNFQIPANALWTAAGAGCIAALLAARNARPPVFRWRALVAVPVLILCAVQAGREATSAHLFSAARSAPDHQRIPRLLTAERIHPRCGEAAVEIGLTLLDAGEAGPEILEIAERALAANALSPAAHRLRGRVQLLDPEADPRPAFAQALRFTNPDDRRRHQLNVGLQYLHRGRLEEGLAWIRDLLVRRNGVDPDFESILRRLYESHPAYDVVRLAIPPGSPEAHAALAAILLEKGDFRGREIELAAARNEVADPSRITIAPDVHLTDWSVEERLENGRRVAEVTLGFENSAVGSPELIVRCTGPQAELHRWFQVSDRPFRYGFHLDPTLPPGPYAFTLNIHGTRWRFPLRRLTIEETFLDLGIDDVMPAEDALYWASADPRRRDRPRHGIPLRGGDLLWRRVSLPESAGDLVVVTEAPADLAVSIDGQELRSASVHGALAQRFATGAHRGGLLEIRSRDDRAPVVLKLFLLPGGDR